MKGPALWQDQYLGRVRTIIAKHRWAIQFTAIDGNPLMYTVGLTAMKLPELVIVGLPHTLATDALNQAATGHTTHQIRPRGALVDAGLSVLLRPAPLPLALVKEYLRTARALYGNRVTAVQLWWPDAAGHYPDDSGWTSGTAQTLPGPGEGTRR